MISKQMLTDFVNTIGQEYVITDGATLQLAATTNYLTQQQIALILRPATTAELQQCIKIANQYKQPVYPVSTGKNWGYGSRVPVTDNNVLIELHRLNRILDYNETLGYITVEPGVTFNQAFHFFCASSSPN